MPKTARQQERGMPAEAVKPFQPPTNTKTTTLLLPLGETNAKLPSFRRRPESTVPFRGERGREQAKPKTPDNSRGMRVGTMGRMDSSNCPSFATVPLGGRGPG